MLAFATIGSAALYLLFIWLLSAAGGAWVAERKGYTERVGLMFGLVLSIVGFVIVLLLPGRPGSTWKTEGAFPNPGARRPLGIPALGPIPAATEQSDALGPSLGDAPSSPPSSPAGADAREGGEAPAAEPPAADGRDGDAQAD